MGVAAIKAGGEAGLLPRAGCCGARTTSTLCQNEFLNMLLAKLEEQDQEYDSAYLYQQQVKSGHGVQGHKYTIMYQRTERESEVPPHESGVRVVVSQKVRRLLRLDWGPDGLAYEELEARLSEALLIQSKVFDRPLRPSELLQQLMEVQHKAFDQDEWASFNFCYHMIGQSPGKAYHYR
ncbi:hypothetical protein AK812_SmicGene29126 [Symbiodinium microadriaticum]|uniref:Uncharacterized protein n=1 Tax=Symbiodinium microadriaticum TaxID=2951 RepID=A0A1Q9D2M4_SYMMI|nr:hypothetical protein AK812_SmicGene29126 [Symbiodinium microadriaticum]CAE7460620.1 unnamed protein product [Symbiodinium sp. KB8]CAE7723113.1 unnamed protein product [Symbiodinium microadriaticum]|eukprot:s165_g31.t1